MQRIFNDHFNTVANSGIYIRDTVFENVDKMLHCGDYDYGHALYGCEFCGSTKVVPFRCKSRFCTTCGNLYSFRRSTAMSFKLIRTSHRHCVFTIPEELRPFFAKTVNSWTVSFMLFVIPFSVCFTKWINLKTLLPASFAFSILLVEASNGIPIFMFFYPKVVQAISLFGAMLNTSTILSFVILFVWFY